MRLVIRIVKWMLALSVLAFFHYALPQHDLVKITSTEIIRTDMGGFNSVFYAQADSGNAAQATRDLRLINTQKQQTWLFGFWPRDKVRVMVYRNEDTGWNWPPYFKFDSSDLQAEADANVSPPGGESWVVLTHYGWRNRFLTIYPNAVAIRPVPGPETRIIPWFNIVFFIALGGVLLFLRAAWAQFRERMVDPALDKVEDRWDELEAGIGQRRSRLARWWRGRQ